MAESKLAKKMKLKEGQTAAVLNAPEGYLQEMGLLFDGVKVSTKADTPVDWIQIFVHNQAELEKVLPQALKLFKPDSVFWIAYPKKTSKIQTDLTRDTGWAFLQDKNLRWLTLVSINETWSAFAMRRYKEGETRQSFV
jgi:hypothetical protein